ncbi:MAG: AEC family transporter [Planctomycetes bacterium]|nr:AEC family transporter [Planctomycetota bacterium]
MYVINTLTPLFVLVLLGYILRKQRFVEESAWQATNRLVYWIALPCLLFSKTAQNQLDSGPALRIFLVLLAGTLLAAALAYLVCLVLRIPWKSCGAFVQGSFRSNLAYVGLPVVLFSLAGADGYVDPKLEAAAVLAIAPLIPIYNLISVIVLLTGQEGVQMSKRRRAQKIAFKVVTNPLLLACAFGIAYSMTGQKLPLVLNRTLSGLGQMAMPLALLGIGAALSFKTLHGGMLHASAAAIIKIVAMPLIGFMAGSAFGMPLVEIRMAMLYLACPTAVASFVMADQLGADKKLAANIVVLTILLAIPAMAIVLLM